MEEEQKNEINGGQSSLLEQLVENSRKQLFYSRIASLSVTVLAVAVVISLLLVIPEALATVQKVNSAIGTSMETVELANTAIKSVTQMSDSITDMGENMDAFITDNAQAVAEVMSKIEAVDFEGLNSAIQDLGDVIEPLAKFFRIMH